MTSSCMAQSSDGPLRRKAGRSGVAAGAPTPEHVRTTRSLLDGEVRVADVVHLAVAVPRYANTSLRCGRTGNGPVERAGARRVGHSRSSELRPGVAAIAAQLDEERI